MSFYYCQKCGYPTKKYSISKGLIPKCQKCRELMNNYIVLNFYCPECKKRIKDIVVKRESCSCKACGSKLEKVAKEYHINPFIFLRFEDKKTNIYINNRRFQQCKYLLRNLGTIEMVASKGAENIDVAVDSIDSYLRILDKEYVESWNKAKIDPIQEFWGHCSNLQAWHDNDYDTSILSLSLSASLLRELRRVGDPVAEDVYLEDLGRRLSSSHRNTVLYTMENDLKDISIEALRELSINIVFPDLKYHIERYLDLIELSVISAKRYPYSLSLNLEPLSRRSSKGSPEQDKRRHIGGGKAHGAHSEHHFLVKYKVRMCNLPSISESLVLMSKRFHFANNRLIKDYASQEVFSHVSHDILFSLKEKGKIKSFQINFKLMKKKERHEKLPLLVY